MQDTTIRTVFEIINADKMENVGEAISILINEEMKQGKKIRDFF